MKLLQNYRHSSFTNRCWFNLKPSQMLGGIGCFSKHYPRFSMYNASLNWDTWEYKNKLTKVEPNEIIN